MIAVFVKDLQQFVKTNCKIDNDFEIFHLKILDKRKSNFIIKLESILIFQAIFPCEVAEV